MVAADNGRTPNLPFMLALVWIAGLPTVLLARYPLFKTVRVVKPDRVAFLLAVAPLALAAVRSSVSF